MITLRKAGEDETFVADMVSRTYNLRQTCEYTWTGDEDEVPVAGDSVWADGYGGLESSYSVTDPEGTLHRFVVLRMTAWGDYVGDSVTRSNHRTLLEDYPDTFVHLRGAYGYEALALPMLAVIPTALADALREVHDEYPLYDESDLSALESELEDDDWACYVRDDFRSAILEASGDDEDDLGIGLDDESLLERYWQGRQDDRIEWYAETAVGGYVRGLEEYAREIVAEIVGEWSRRVDQGGFTPGQEVLPLAV